MTARTASLVAGALVVAAAALGAAATTARAADCAPGARDLLVTFQPVKNSDAGTSFQARLTLANRSAGCALPAAGWHLYFNSVRQPLAVYPAGEPGDSARAQLASQGLSVRRGDTARSGDLYVLEPAAGFRPVQPGEQRTIDIGFELWAILKTDAPAGWHIAFGDAAPHWVPARVRLDADDPAQTTAFSGDDNPVQTAATRFAGNTAKPMRLSLRDRILPRPLHAQATRGAFALTRATRVDAPASLSGEASYLRSALGDVLGGHGGSGSIELALDGGLDPEAYTLTVARDGIRIAGGDGAGVLYGIETLRQLIPAAAYRAAASGRPWSEVDVSGARIDDAPLFGYRGLQIDVARHFLSKATIEKFLDLMAFLKLNKLHLHLTDDEGWRIQIPGLPELTDFGARRGFDPSETSMLHQGMGSGSDLSSADGVLGKPANTTEANLGRRPAWQGFEQATVNYVGQGSGYYTTDDFEEILRYATARHIAVIPEFDFPAHARAAVQAEKRSGRYPLLDPGDTSHHVSVQYYTDDLANPCLESTYRFLDKVVTEVAAMYRAAGAPLEMVNLGGDEAPGPDRWQHSPACASNPATAGKSDQELMDYFYTRWNEIGLRVAPRTAGWEDILLDGSGSLRLPDFVALPWQNVWGWGREQIAYQFANEGIPVVLAHATNLYMDLAYEKDPDEPGYYWAAFVDEKKTFTYQPFDVYANATEDRWGNPFTPDPSWTRLTPEGRRNILGMEAELWGENGKSPELREYQAFPKLLGAAERAWNRDTPTPAEMPAAWNVFCNTLGQATFPLLSWYRPVGLPGAGTGVNYRIPPPGAVIRDGVLEANVRDPGLAIEYSRDGQRWHAYGRPVRVGGPAFVRTRAPDGRTSRVEPVSYETVP